MSLEVKRPSSVNMPVFHGGGNSKAVDRRVKLAELVLRCLIFALGVLAAVLVGTDRQVKTFFSFNKKARFTDVKALVYLMIASVIASGYSMIQGIRCIACLTSGRVLFEKPLAWTIFSADQAGNSDTAKKARSWLFIQDFIKMAMTYVMLSAVAAAVQSSIFARVGLAEFQWIRVCDMYDKFCMQMGVALAVAMVACLTMVALSCISSFNLFRLYGNDKAKGTGL